ncbi:DUF2061 domain-containing protein [Arsukibacterium sp.]|uniref:DUF2061 domain-containing protein n=1 Tax=Arsukibacterium sp. TaxID=1977258 RepID=UPI00299E2966|nr:DUF2061 domain-containing protein [Arsukibacterium sp.]MDX1676857.1 DUF2061 domain-containing protein [Arsukibacterium sp.]
MLKTTTFAIMHFSIAFTVTYVITGDLVLGGLVAVIEPAANTVAYFFHEKIWQRLQQRTGQPRVGFYKSHTVKL